MKTKSNILIHSSMLLFFLLFFSLVYMPLIQGHYFYPDDYMRLWTSTWVEDTNQSYASYSHVLPAEGRPLNVLYNHIIFNKYINSLKSYEAANTVRIIGIIGVGLLSYVLFLFFQANNFRNSHAVLLSILICTLPPIQIYLAMLLGIVHIYSILLSSLSFLILFKAVFKEHSFKKTDIVAAFSISMVLFIASLCIYQPTALVYWSLAIIPITTMKNEDFLKNNSRSFMIYFSAGFAAMIIYFAIVKVHNFAFDLEFQNRGSLVHSVDQIFRRLYWFIKGPLNDSLNLWNSIYYKKEIKILVLMVIATGFLYALIRTVRQVTSEKKGFNHFWNLIIRYLLIVIIIPLSHLAHIATAGGGQDFLIHHRTLAALEIVMILLFYWCLMNAAEFIKTLLNLSTDVKNKIITIGLVMLTIVAAYLANHNIDKYIVKHNTNEYMYVKDIIQGYGISKLSKNPIIYAKTARLPSLKNGQDIRSVYGEFYRRSPVNVLAKLILYELGINSDISFVTIHNYDPITGEPIDEHDKRYKRLPEDQNVLKIDMAKMNIKETYDYSGLHYFNY